MKCTSPLLAYRWEGKIVFNSPFPFARGFNLPCGRCSMCRLNYARQWAVRCVDEAQMHESSSFITLTFNPESLLNRENPWSLNVKDFQLFMKKLRNLHTKKSIRFFHCGEYGEENKRPHYHALIFNHNFPDKKLWKIRDGISLYISKELESIWPYGFSTIGEVTFQSASYVARYSMKKVHGDEAEDYYKHISENGKVTPIKPQYCTMSRKPGLGDTWLKKFHTDVFPHDYIVREKHEMKPPRYYLEQLNNEKHELYNPTLYEEIKKNRQKQMDDPIEGYGPEQDRLWVQEEVKQQALKRLIRNL
jgi:hypothetical protein